MIFYTNIIILFISRNGIKYGYLQILVLILYGINLNLKAFNFKV